MADINDMRRARKAAADDMKAKADALAALEDQDGSTAEALAEASGAYDTAKATFSKVDAQVKRAEEAEAAAAASAVSEEPTPAPAAPQATGGAPAQVKDKGVTFARLTRTLAAANGNIHLAQQIAEQRGDSGLMAAMNKGTDAAGGFLVPEDISSEIIELLRPASIVTEMNPVIVDMPNGNLTMNRRVSGATFSYGTEGSDAPATGYQLGQVKLSAKKMHGLVPISNDLMRSASTAVDAMVRDDIVADASQIQDRFFLRGDGSANAPKGYRYQLVGTAFEATNILTMTATPTIQKVDNDLGRMELALSRQNVPHTGAYWIMAPRVEQFLTNLRDGNGNKVYPEMGDGRLRGKAYRVTTEIPDNLGAGTDESEIMLVHPRHTIVGEHMGIEIAVSTDAAYKDDSNQMQSAFSRDETLMRLIMQHDIGLRHLPSVAILKGVTWAPGSI